jgi:hypothetical protein
MDMMVAIVPDSQNPNMMRMICMIPTYLSSMQSHVSAMATYITARKPMDTRILSAKSPITPMMKNPMICPSP